MLFIIYWRTLAIPQSVLVRLGKCSPDERSEIRVWARQHFAPHFADAHAGYALIG